MKRMRSHREARGIATIELMVVTPILVLLLAAISEIGWAFHHYKTLTRATRDGVRYVAGEALRSGVGIVIIDATLRAETQTLVVYGATNPTDQPLLPGFSIGDVIVESVDSQHVRVEARYQYQPTFFTYLPFFSGTSPALSFSMNSSTVMRAL